MKKEAVITKKTLKLWQFRVGLITILLFIIFFRLLLISVWMLIPLVIIISLSSIFIFWYIPLYFKNYRIYYSQVSFEIHRGVFFKATLIMPYPRLIYVSAYSSPISRKMGLSGAVLKASRGLIIVPEINKQDIDMLMRIAAGENNEAI